MSTVAVEPELITRKGHERLSAELERLRAIWNRGDAEVAPRERAGLAGLLEDRTALERRIAQLEATLARARIAGPPQLGVAGIGQPVRIRIDGSGLRDCQLVGAVEADPASGGISVRSPIGSALVGRRAGDVVEVVTPGGIRTIDVVSVG